ncbi:MAG: glutathione S-transferase family protein [Bdellovibrionales bacterium]
MIKIYGAKAFRPELKGAIRDIRPIWLLEELGVPYERIALDPTKGENKTPEYLKLNPTGKVPTLVDGITVLFESALICEYLAEKNKELMPPPGTEKSYKCRQWNYWCATNLEIQTSRLFGADFFLDKGATADEIAEMALSTLPRFLNPLEERLAQQKFMLGDAFSVTDIFVTCALYVVKHRPLLNDYPALKMHYETCTARPAFQKALMVNGEDASKTGN